MGEAHVGHHNMVNLIEEEVAPPEIKEIYNEIKGHFNLDFVPNAFKALAYQGSEALRQALSGLMEAEEFWGKETAYLLGLAVDIANGCSYCINFDTAMLKQMGYDDTKIETLVNFVSMNTMYNTYVEGLQLEPDVMPSTIEQRKAA